MGVAFTAAPLAAHMAPVSPQYWTALQHTLAWSIFNGADTALSCTMVAALFTARGAVKGTRRRYLASTWIRGLGVPLIGAELFRTIVSIAAQDWFGAVLAVVNAFIYASWIRQHGDDDFWSDISNKLKRKLRSLSARRQTAFAGTGA